MEQENKNLLAYFDKFKGYSNFDKLKQKLDKDSEIKYLHDIEIGELSVPYIGPSDELKKFPKIVEKEWGKKESQELKYILKYYDGGDIESLEEAIILLDIKYRETNDENYLKVKDKLIAGADIVENDLEFLVNQTDIMTSSLVFYLL